jgi:predicted esterase
MADLNFQAFRDRVFHLYNLAAYSEALALIDEQAARFAQDGSDLYFWRACLACRAGDATAALAWLQEASDRGYWYHERMLQDPDLAMLHERDRLEPLRAVFRERHAAAQAQARPQLKEWSPTGPRKGLLLALHGAGGNIANEEEIAQWQPAVAQGWQVALAQSSQVWAPGKYFWQDRSLGITEVASHLATLQAPENTVLAGFSAGAALAIHAVLSGTLPVTRFLAVAPAIRLESVLPLLAACRRDVHGYVVVGELDWCRPASVELANAMRQGNLRCELELHPNLTHDFPPEFSAQLDQRLTTLGA